MQGGWDESSLCPFPKSSCQVSWTPGKRLDLLLLKAGGSKSSVHRGNKHGEEEVKGSNQSETVFGWRKTLCCVHALMHAFIHLLTGIS